MAIAIVYSMFMATLWLDLATQVLNDSGRPISSRMTVEQAVRWMVEHDSEQPAYFEAGWKVTVGAHSKSGHPVSIEKQNARMIRRCKKIALGCDRVVRQDTLEVNGVLCSVLMVR